MQIRYLLVLIITIPFGIVIIITFSLSPIIVIEMGIYSIIVWKLLKYKEPCVCRYYPKDTGEKREGGS